MTTPFAGRFVDDNKHLGYMLENLDEYRNNPETLLSFLRESRRQVVTGLFADSTAVTAVTNCFEALPKGASPVDNEDNEIVMQYAKQLLILVDDVDKANEGIEEENAMAKAEQIRQRLEEAEKNLRLLLTKAPDTLESVPADIAGTGLVTYLTSTLDTGGCNNVFAADARTVLEPLARYGYQPMSESSGAI